MARFFCIKRKDKFEEFKKAFDLNNINTEESLVKFAANFYKDPVVNYISKIKEFPKNDVRIIYSMWTGYIEENLTLKTLLDTYPTYICHASGHVSKDDLVKFIELVNPDTIIPVHTDNPERLEELVPHRNVYVVNDNESFII